MLEKDINELLQDYKYRKNILEEITLADIDKWNNIDIDVSWSDVLNKPTDLEGYGLKTEIKENTLNKFSAVNGDFLVNLGFNIKYGDYSIFGIQTDVTTGAPTPKFGMVYDNEMYSYVSTALGNLNLIASDSVYLDTPHFNLKTPWFYVSTEYGTFDVDLKNANAEIFTNVPFRTEKPIKVPKLDILNSSSTREGMLYNSTYKVNDVVHDGIHLRHEDGKYLVLGHLDSTAGENGTVYSYMICDKDGVLRNPSDGDEWGPIRFEQNVFFRHGLRISSGEPLIINNYNVATKIANIENAITTGTGMVQWSNVLNKPSTFTPSSHTHNYAGSSSAGGSATSALNINNAGTVTLASATEQNAIDITAPNYIQNNPVKLLNFNWYSNKWSLGIRRGGSTDDVGLGIYHNNTLYTNINTSGIETNGLTLGGNITFKDSGTANRGIEGTMGADDRWRIVGGATEANKGFLQIATADDAEEPIYVSQYYGQFVTEKRRLYLLNEWGNMVLPKETSLYLQNNSFLRAHNTAGFSENNLIGLDNLNQVSVGNERHSLVLRTDYGAYIARSNIGTHYAYMGVSTTVGEALYGSRLSGATDYSSYIRVGPSILQYNNGTNNYNIYHEGNYPWKIASRGGNGNMETNNAARNRGLSMLEIYNYSGGYPIQYGNVLELGGNGVNQLAFQWNDGSTPGGMYHRCLHDISNTWTGWRRLAYADELNSLACTMFVGSVKSYGITESIKKYGACVTTVPAQGSSQQVIQFVAPWAGTYLFIVRCRGTNGAGIAVSNIDVGYTYNDRKTVCQETLETGITFRQMDANGVAFIAWWSSASYVYGVDAEVTILKLNV